MVINSKENNITNFPKLATNNENKENYQNVPKFKKLETEMKNYETLVVELNKLSIEEQNAGKKLFTRNKVCSILRILCLYYVQNKKKPDGRLLHKSVALFLIFIRAPQFA